MSANSFGAKAELEVGGRTYEIFRIDALHGQNVESLTLTGHEKFTITGIAANGHIPRFRPAV